MAKKASPKKKTTQPKETLPKRINALSLRKKALLIILLVALVGLVLGGREYINYRNSIATERAQFMEAKSNLDTLYNDIVTEAGPPAEHKSVQSCMYTSAEFSTGSLSCEVSQFFIYRQTNDGSLTVVDKIKAVLNNSKYIFDVKPVNLSANSGGSSKNLAAFSFTNSNGFRCLVDVWELNGAMPFQTFGFYAAEKQGTFTAASCSSSAQDAYFKPSTTKSGAPLY